MKQFRACLCLGLLFLTMDRVFQDVSQFFPNTKEWGMVYFAGAATVDWMLYRITFRICTGALCRDIEALYIASIIVHAIGFALYMAWSPPYLHDFLIKGINYVFAIKLIFTGGSDVYNNFSWRDLVRGFAHGRMGYQAKEAQQ